MLVRGEVRVSHRAFLRISLAKKFAQPKPSDRSSNNGEESSNQVIQCAASGRWAVGATAAIMNNVNTNREM